MQQIELQSAFFQQRHTNDMLIMTSDDNDYRHYGRKTAPYDTYFRDLLKSIGESNFYDMLEKRVGRHGERQKVLDLFAPPSSFIEYLYLSDKSGEVIDSCTSLTLMDTVRASTLPVTDKIRYILGDVLRGDVWNYLDKQYDVITCRPQSPFRDKVLNPFVYYPVLTRAWSRLSTQDGLLFAQLPRLHTEPGQHSLVHKLVDNWSTFLNSRNIACTLIKPYQRPEFIDINMVIQKDTRSPKNFPRFQEFVLWREK